MRSFTSALIFAALATLGSAAPVGLSSVTHTVSVPSTVLPSIVFPTTVPGSVGGVKPVAGRVESEAGKIKSATATVHARSDPKITGVVESIPSKVSKVDVRAVPPSVAAIFDNILTQIQPYATQLTFMTPSNASVTEITNTVTSIKGPIIGAVPVLQALAGEEASIILAPAHPVAGEAELTVSDVATVVAVDVNLVLAAAGSVIEVTNAIGGDIVTEVKGPLLDLGAAVVSLVSATDSDVSGLSTSLAPKVESSSSVLSYFDSIGLSLTLGLTI